MTEIKCTNCGKKLAEANVQQGELRIKCKCGTVNIVKAETEPKTESYTERVGKTIEKK
jgi:phage FluMu protein Com